MEAWRPTRLGQIPKGMTIGPVPLDTGGQKAFAFCFGYIQALLQQLRAEA